MSNEHDRIAHLEAVIAEARELLEHTHCLQDDHDDALGVLSRAGDAA